MVWCVEIDHAMASGAQDAVAAKNCKDQKAEI
jgi:hypothetical protein